MITLELIKTVREKSGAGIADCKKALEENNGDITSALDWLRAKGIAKAAKKADRIAAEGQSIVEVLGNNAFIIELNSETDFAAKSGPFNELLNEVVHSIALSTAGTLEEAHQASMRGTNVQQEIEASTGKIGEKLTLRRVARLTKSNDEVFAHYIHMGGKIASLVVVKPLGEVADLSEVADDLAVQIAASAPKYIKETDIPKEEFDDLQVRFLKAVKDDPKFANNPRLDQIVQGKVRKELQETTLLFQDYFKAEQGTSLKVGDFIKAKHVEIVAFVRFEVGEGLEKRVDNFAEEVAKQIKG
jgi:elongation factor Ts